MIELEEEEEGESEEWKGAESQERKKRAAHQKLCPHFVMNASLISSEQMGLDYTHKEGISKEGWSAHCGLFFLSSFLPNPY